MKVFLEFARARPWSTFGVIALLFLSSLAEGLGYSSLLPLITLAVGGSSGEVGGFEAFVNNSLERVGIAPTFGALGAVLVAAFFLKGAVRLAAGRQAGYTAASVVKGLRFRMLSALMQTSWGYYAQLRIGAVANSYSTEADRAARSYRQACELIALALRISVYIAVAVAMSWEVALVAVVLGAAIVRLMRPFIRMGRRAGERRTHLLTDTGGRLADLLQGVKPLKAMARAGLVAPLLKKGILRLEKAARKKVISQEALNSLTEPLVVMILVAGAYLSLEVFAIQTSNMLMMVILTSRTLMSMGKLQDRYHQIVVHESAYWSLKRTVDEAETREEHTAGTTAPSLTEGIELVDVSFSQGADRVFENLGLRIEAGVITALMGPSGSGKTTLVDMVAGLVSPDAGEIRIDGTPLEKLDLIAWRHRIGYVAQELFLLHDSVELNVSLGDPEISRADVERALVEAHAWDFVSRLPEGMDTLVGERGIALSGGERQRIAIARALLHRPWLLILDEATTALDPESESALWQAVQELRGRTTVLAISHQKALIDVADRVYRIADGCATQLDPGNAPDTTQASFTFDEGEAS